VPTLDGMSEDRRRLLRDSCSFRRRRAEQCCGPSSQNPTSELTRDPSLVQGPTQPREYAGGTGFRTRDAVEDGAPRVGGRKEKGRSSGEREPKYRRVARRRKGDEAS